MFGDGIQGLPVSLDSLLENPPIEGLRGNHLLQPCVLFLQSLQLLGHLWFHATLLLKPIILTPVKTRLFRKSEYRQL